MPWIFALFQMGFQPMLPMSALVDFFKESFSSLQRGSSRPLSDFRGYRLLKHDQDKQGTVSLEILSFVSPSYTKCPDKLPDPDEEEDIPDLGASQKKKKLYEVKVNLKEKKS